MFTASQYKKSVDASKILVSINLTNEIILNEMSFVVSKRLQIDFPKFSIFFVTNFPESYRINTIVLQRLYLNSASKSYHVRKQFSQYTFRLQYSEIQKQCAFFIGGFPLSNSIK